MFAKVRILPDLPFPCHVTMGYRLGALHLARAAPESPTGSDPEHHTADGIGRRKPGIRAAHPKTPRRLKQIEAKRTAILDAALGLFSRFGLHGTTVEQVAADASVSKTNLFYYFASKEAVYVGVLSRLLDQWLAPLRGLKPDSDPIDGIGEYISRKVAFSRTNPEASRLFCLEIVQGAPLLRAELEGPLRGLVESKAAILRGWIDQGRIGAHDPHHLIFSIWAITQHYADFAVQVDAITGHDLSDEAFFERTVASTQRLILAGLGLA